MVWHPGKPTGKIYETESIPSMCNYVAIGCRAS